MSRYVAIATQMLERECRGGLRDAFAKVLEHEVKDEVGLRGDRIRAVVIDRLLEPAMAAAAEDGKAGNTAAAYGRLNAAVEEALDVLRKAIDPNETMWR